MARLERKTAGAIGACPRTEIVTDERRLEALATDWTALLAATPLGSGFQSLAWARACRTAIRGRALSTLVVRDDDEVVGIVPTELGTDGRLTFIGDAVGNYFGPVYRPDRVGVVLAALDDFLAAEPGVRILDFRALREGTPFLAALRTWRPAGWTIRPPLRTATCPYLDLTPGWAALLARHKGLRTTLARKRRMLERLGEVAFVERTACADVAEALPALFRLFEARWEGRHESGGFAGRYRDFHAHALPLLAEAGHAHLSLVVVDGATVAFSYGLRADGVTSSYVLAHDPPLGGCSPGLVLLVGQLEAACARGDREYDFSIGEEGYKTQWATGRRGVFRVLGWRRGSAAGPRVRFEALRARVWIAARSVELLRSARREGLRRTVLGTPPRATADSPGLAAGPVGRWSVHRVLPEAPDATLGIEAWGYRRMAAALSPRHLALAAERACRGDICWGLSADGRLLGVVWRAAAARRAHVAGGVALPGSQPVYYHPVAADGDVGELVRALARVEPGRRGFLLVTASPLGATASEPLATFSADPVFRTPPPGA